MLYFSFTFYFQLYEINDDPKRKEFLDDLFLFMQKRGKRKIVFSLLYFYFKNILFLYI